MHNIILKSIVFFVVLFSSAMAQKIAAIDVSVAAAGDKLYAIAQLDLDKITMLPDDQLALYLIDSAEKREVPVQLNKAEQRILYWMVDGSGKEKKHYELHKVNGKKETDNIKFRKENGQLIFSSGSNDLLGYQFETMYPPAGIDTLYKRSGYIHPLWSPAGRVLTRIQPPDHYHHYGIWNPWTHVLFEKDTVDFWNLKKGQGTVRHSKFISIQQGAVFGEFQALHEHVVFKKEGVEKVALNELQTVRIYNLYDETYLVDFFVNLNCASQSPVKLLEYRYGGFGWRATEKWDKDNSEMLSSQGKTRKDIDNTTGEWFYVQGQLDSTYGGILMMSNPANFNQPQPVRMWGIPEEGRGDVFASFSPTRNRDWLLEPGKNYILRYRFVVYNGHFNAKIAEQFWFNYINPAKLVVTVTN